MYNTIITTNIIQKISSPTNYGVLMCCVKKKFSYFNKNFKLLKVARNILKWKHEVSKE